MKVLLFLFMAALSAQSSQARAFGFWVSNENFEADFTIHKSVHPGRIEDYISKNNPSAAPFAGEMAKEILAASRCLKIDPIYMTAKIHRESTFYPDAVSHSGAVGLSQMTSIGIKEIQDQLGMRGSGYARSSNTAYLRRSIRYCMSYSEYTDFFDTFSGPRSSIRKKLKKNVRYSLFAGAALLKVYLAQAKDKYPNISIQATYRQALEQYNGESTKASYARWIKKRVDVFNSRF